MATADRRTSWMRGWVSRWWRGEAGRSGRVLDALLWPEELLFHAGVAARNGAYDRGLLPVDPAPIPVVSVGNIGVGGAGKTPVAAWIAMRLSEWGHRPAIVLRGYGADEILVHREINPNVPVFVAARRIHAVREAAGQGRDVAVMDDGFQHRRLQRQLDLALVAVDGWGRNRHLLPRGPWREGLGALARADLVLLTRKAATDADAGELEAAVADYIDRENIVHCRIAPTGLLAIHEPLGDGDRKPLADLRDRRVLAVASLAEPGPFAAHLREVGAEVEVASFPDHHAFTGEEAAGLLKQSAGRPLVMTRKEAVKLRPLLPADVEAWMLDQRVEIDRGAAVLELALREAVRR